MRPASIASRARRSPFNPPISACLSTRRCGATERRRTMRDRDFSFYTKVKLPDLYIINYTCFWLDGLIEMN
jgi:hypothetical protein